jgi:hypothetical protein
MPIVNVAPNEIIKSADMNLALNQGVMVFADAGERAAQFTAEGITVTEGMQSYSTSTKTLEIYKDGRWQPLIGTSVDKNYVDNLTITSGVWRWVTPTDPSVFQGDGKAWQWGDQDTLVLASVDANGVDRGPSLTEGVYNLHVIGGPLDGSVPQNWWTAGTLLISYSNYMDTGDVETDAKMGAAVVLQSYLTSNWVPPAPGELFRATWSPFYLPLPFAFNYAGLFPNTAAAEDIPTHSHWGLIGSSVSSATHLLYGWADVSTHTSDVLFKSAKTGDVVRAVGIWYPAMLEANITGPQTVFAGTDGNSRFLTPISVRSVTGTLQSFHQITVFPRPLPPGGTEGQSLKIVGGVPTWQ